MHKVSLKVDEGQIFGIIGPNGAGKTTLLNVIAGVFRPEGGSVTFRGHDITGQSPESICRQGLARTFQIPKPFLGMSALENVTVAAVFGNLHRTAGPRHIAEESLAFVNFPLAAETPASSLNPLQLKRLDLARALASHPRLLILDEIAAGLRPSEYTELIEIIRRVRDQGTTILMVEHVLRVVMQVCERLVVLDYGVKIAEGTPSEIVENEQVVEAYLGKKHTL